MATRIRQAPSRTRHRCHATQRAVRGEIRTHKTDGTYRATRRGDSTHTRARSESVAAELLKGGLRPEPGKSKLIETRKKVERAWSATSDILNAQGHPELAAYIRRFLAHMPPPMTERELVAHELRPRLRAPLVPDRNQNR